MAELLTRANSLIIFLLLQFLLQSASAANIFPRETAVTNSSSSAAAPSVTVGCQINGKGRSWDGKPIASPESWCICSTGGAQGIYPTISGKSGSDGCAYSTLPSKTISVNLNANSSATGAVVVTSCALQTPAGKDAYCTCNDNSAWGSPVLQTAVATDGKTSTKCSLPDPTGKPLCGNYAKVFGNERPGKTFNRAQGQDALNKFCGLVEGLDNKTSPAYNLGATETSGAQSREIFFTGSEGEYCWSEAVMDTNYNLGQWGLGADCNSPISTWLTIMFQRVKDNSTFCDTPADKWELPKGQKECFDKLNPIIDGCDLDTTDNKNGGVYRVRTGAGCFDIGIFATEHAGKGGKGTYPAGKPDLNNYIGM